MKLVAAKIKDVCVDCYEYSSMHNQCRLQRGVPVCKLYKCPLGKWTMENLLKLP